MKEFLDSFITKDIYRVDENIPDPILIAKKYKDEYIAHENLPIYKWKSSIIEKMRKYSPELVPPGY